MPHAAIAAYLRPARLALRRWLRMAEWQATLVWAVAAGLLGAAATELFRAALFGLDRAVLGQGGSLVAIARSLPAWARVAAPVAGGLVAGALLVAARRTAVQKATSDYMEAIVLGDGRIPVRQTLLRSGSSLVSIASGGSIGREGSMVQLAALCSSLLGRALRMGPERLRLLVACGAAAGLTAAYNAPIAGAFFVAEIVLGSIAMESVGPLLVAAVVANIAMRALPHYQAPYRMPDFPAIAGWEVLLFIPLGVLLGLGAAVFLRGLQASRAAFARLPLGLPLRLAAGGLVVGLLSVAWPQVWGNGYSVVNTVLHEQLAWPLLATLLVAKLVATWATAGSGAVGGVFTPALFFGCMTGAVFGQAAGALWPGGTSAPFAYAIVGMGAFLAAAAQAPLMAILMIFEMTLSYQVMLPLMLASVVAYFVARSCDAGSMYEITLRRRAEQGERTRLRGLSVQALVEPAATVVGPDATLAEMRALFRAAPVKYLYVTDERQHFLGVVPLAALGAGTDDLGDARAFDLMRSEIAPLCADMNLGQALQRFLEYPGERLPVVASASDPTLLGAARKSVLLQTYVRLSG